MLSRKKGLDFPIRKIRVPWDIWSSDKTLVYRNVNRITLYLDYAGVLKHHPIRSESAILTQY